MHYLLSIYMMINLNMYRTNHHTLEELRNNFHEVSTISREEVRRVNNTSAGILTAYGQGGATFSASAVALLCFYWTFYSLLSQRIFCALPSLTVKPPMTQCMT
jgi:hypothetical protein